MPDPIALSSDAELRALVERALSSSYDLDQEIGRGGMGIVYRAKDRRLKRTVAIKLLPPELAFRSEIRSRFLREAETAAQLSHPNIVPIYSVDEREGLVFFVMACVEGLNLAKLLQEEPKIGIDETRRILLGVGEALAYAHARGVVHRDIKPDNILLDAETGRPMVTDFGIARAVQEGGDSRLTATGVAIGTPAYMSPEQAAGDRQIDGRSDLYSLGIVGYQMLAGQLPFNAASTPTMLLKHISELPMPIQQRREELPDDLAAIIMTLLEKEPDNRFPDAATLVRALQGDSSVIPERVPAPATPVRGATWGEAPGGSTGARTGAARSLATGSRAALSGEEITADDIARWSAAPVQEYRKKFASYAAVNAVIVAAAVIADTDLMFITVIWSMVMAARYAKLWSSGYDWRDVFRQSRDRRLVDVASETVDEVRGVFSPEARERKRQRPKRVRPPAPPDPSHALAPPISEREMGVHAATVRQAATSRAEILRLVDGLPKHDRALVADVAPAAEALYSRIHALALALAEQERTEGPHAMVEIEKQIAHLEDQANPLEHAASEERVRRLAYLKRQRRAVAEGARRRERTAARLESCVLALQNMRLDVLRLRAGGVASATGQITMLTERARSLADEVDAAVYGVEEVARALKTPPKRRQEPGQA
ncbi:MAG TPA: serine/threonine-protein kinase [Gemmatimonadaceae bacterium]|nr:serine/threonine-protein kinase [Gemmatimonadaceae bacterium]